jgi:hypothetical protein
MTPSPLAAYRARYLAYCRRVAHCRPPVTFAAWLRVIVGREVRVRNMWWAGRGYQRIKTEYQWFGEEM